MHLALASNYDDPDFRPEPFAGHYQRSILQASRDRLTRTFKLLRSQLNAVPDEVRALCEEVLGLRDALSERLNAITTHKIEVSRIRCHGDFHLGQVLYDGRDFVIIDFEGEPAVSIGVRRLKRSALYDVCGMLRSFHYAATYALEGDRVRDDDRPRLRAWADAWYQWVCAAYLGAYLERAGEAPFLPRTPQELRALIHTHLIDKCAYELSYELNNRPEWMHVPLAGLRTLAG
jgi:maltose alpha-D-glucosyltransferase/alpha-amylase